MTRRRTTRSPLGAPFPFVLLIALASTACGAGVSPEEYDKGVGTTAEAETGSAGAGEPRADAGRLEGEPAVSQGPAEEDGDGAGSKVRFACEDPVRGGGMGARSRGSAFLDYDGDGNLDVIYGNSSRAAPLIRNLGDGTFEEVELEGLETRRAFSMAAGDYDLDGDTDIYLGRGGMLGPAPNVLLENRGGVFVDVTARAGVGNGGMGWGSRLWDYDGDGYLDIYVANYGSPVLYHNEGDGTFTDATDRAGVTGPAIGRDAAWADYDGDGDQDLLVSGHDFYSTGASRLYRNNGDGTFTDVTREAGIDPAHGSVGFALADVNNDGLMDVYQPYWNGWVIEDPRWDVKTHYDIEWRRSTAGQYATHYWPGFASRLYINEGDGTFRLAEDTGLEVRQGSISTAIGDFDNDGFQDVYVGTGGPWFEEEDRVFRNNGDGTFTDVTEESGVEVVGQSHGIITGDYNRDGRLDLYVSTGGMWRWSSSKVNVMCTNVGEGGNWLEVDLGEGSYAVQGALVTLVAGETVQVRQVGGGSGFASVSSPIVHFGLGEAAVVDRVTVRWPDGTGRSIEDVGVNRVITITPDGG